MKNIFVFGFLLFLCTMAQAQYEFQYQLDFKIDSTDRDFVQTEYFNLDVIDKESVFYAAAYAALDSIKRNGGNINSKDAPQPKLDFFVTKDLSEPKVEFKTTIGFAQYNVPEPNTLDWEISSDTKIAHLGIELDTVLHKATTTFKGREWVAWFTPEIAIQDGPYKFYGLPGLIVELHDTRRDYVFSLIGIKKIEHLFSPTLFTELGINTYPIGFSKYKKLKAEFFKNPGAYFKQYMSSMGVKVPNTEVRNFVEKTKARFTKQNNKIELVED